MKMVAVDAFVNACIELYKKLPKTGKPNTNEWTVISCVVGCFSDKDIKVLSLGTGSKCIGKSLMSPEGSVLNDSHAEVIARRAFIKYLYFQIIELNNGQDSEILCRNVEGDIVVKNSVKFYFVTGMSPCGDASIMPMMDDSDVDNGSVGLCVNPSQLTSSSNLKRAHSDDSLFCKKIKTGIKDTTENSIQDIHRTGAKCLPQSTIQDPHLPGTQYHNIGAVRTKPGRGDPTLSLSCSDKIAKWNSVGWQGALLSLFIKNPIFMETIICGGGCPFSKESFDRAVNERINREPFIPILRSNISFPDLKMNGKRPNPSSIIWCCTNENETEVAINGRRLGVTKKNLNKKSARISICKKELFLLFEKTLNSFNDKDELLSGFIHEKKLEDITYGELKSKAVDYYEKWTLIKDKCFKVWSCKPPDLLNFTLKEL